MRRIISLTLFCAIIGAGVLATEVFASDETDLRSNANHFFAALVERNQFEQIKYINGDKFVWGDGFLGFFLKGMTKIGMKDTVSTSFFQGYNETILTPMESKLNRKLTANDFTITSVEIKPKYRAVVTYNTPLNQGKKLFFEKSTGSWLIYKTEQAEDVS